MGKAELLNRHFQSQCSAFPTAQSVPQASNPGHGFHHFDFTPAHVQQILSKLPSGKSPGADRIANEILKATAVSIADPLSRIFNNSLSSGIFPDVWKLATISPIHKSGKDQTQPVSYRPITLLSSVSKVLERVVHEQLLQYCLNNKVIPDEQFGFISGRSAEWQLLTTLENWQVALDKHNHVHAVFLDAAKAFDRVDHQVLLNTLAQAGVGDTVLSWIAGYLSGRLIQAKVEGSCLFIYSFNLQKGQGPIQAQQDKSM